MLAVQAGMLAVHNCMLEVGLGTSAPGHQLIAVYRYLFTPGNFLLEEDLGLLGAGFSCVEIKSTRAKATATIPGWHRAGVVIWEKGRFWEAGGGFGLLSGCWGRLWFVRRDYEVAELYLTKPYKDCFSTFRISLDLGLSILKLIELLSR